MKGLDRSFVSEIEVIWRRICDVKGATTANARASEVAGSVDGMQFGRKIPALNAMTEPTNALTLQLLEWISHQPRTYAEVLEAWRTTCPRLSIWEDACIDGLIDYDPKGSRIVSVSPKGRALLVLRTAGQQDHQKNHEQNHD